MRAIDRAGSKLAISLGLLALALPAAPAGAQTIVEPIINPISPVSVDGSAGSLVPGHGTVNVILNDQGIAEVDGGDGIDPGSSVNVIAIDNVLPLSAVVGVSPASAFQQDLNTIFAVANANVASNSIGLLPGPGGTETTIDGAAILSMQAADAVDLYAESIGSDITGTVTGAGTATASFSGNAIEARGNFNQALSTIETVAYADLFVPTDNGQLSFPGGPLAPEQIASLNVMNVQLNHGFDADTFDGDSDGPMALAEDSSLLFTRDVAPGTTIDGVYDLVANSILAQASSNLSDNSVLLRREIEFVNDNGSPGDPSDDFDDTLAGTSLFEGTAVVTNIQASADTVEGDASLQDAVGIDSVVNGATMEFVFAQGTFGSPAIGTADGLNISVVGNEIESLSSLNGARNQVFFDGGIALDGLPTALTGTEHVFEFALALPVGTLANYQTNNIQLAGSVDDDPQNAQTGLARVLNASIVLGIEDADGMTAAFNGNALVAGAVGNEAVNIVGNGIDEVTTSIVGTSASTNAQFIFEPEIDSNVGISGPEQITLQVGFDDATDIGFGGLLGTALSFQGNAATAQSAGNVFASETLFTAGSLEMSYTAGVANASGSVALDQSAAILAVDAGAVTASVQILDGREPGLDSNDPSVQAAISFTHLGVFVNDPIAPAAAGLADSNVSVVGNALQSTAVGNSFSGVTALGTAGQLATTSFTGSTATASSQFSQGQIVSARVIASDLRVRLGAGTVAGENPSDLQVSVADNAIAALSQGNTSASTMLLSAQSITGGATDDANALIGSSTAPLQGPTLGINFLEGDAAVLSFSNQFNHHGQGGASVVSDLEVTIGDGAAALELESSVIAVTGNELVATTHGNFASNGIGISALTATTARAGALAGIVSQQQSAAAEPVPGVLDPPQYLANLNGSQLQVNLMDLLGSSVTVSDNRMAADMAINAVGNTIIAQVQSFDLDNGPAGSVLTAIPTGDDVDLSVGSSAFFIANSQRNEALQPYDGDPAGPPTLAGTFAQVFVQFSSIATTVGSVTGGQNDLSLAVNGNAIEGRLSSNDAVNQIGLSGQSGFVDAGILNHQVNSGSLGFVSPAFPGMTTLSITTTLQGTTNSDVAVQMLGNRIGYDLAGNKAVNTLSATMQTGFSGVAAGGASIAASSFVHAPGEILASGNLVVLNTQSSYGVVDDEGESVPQLLQADLSLATLGLEALGSTDGGSFRLEGNAIGSSAAANSASNTILASTTVGDLPGATIVNHQQASGTSVVATAVDTSISLSLGSVTDGSATLSSNQIGTSATINNSSNTISAPGQTFTRTTSF